MLSYVCTYVVPSILISSILFGCDPACLAICFKNCHIFADILRNYSQYDSNFQRIK